jgi:serine/threonine protein kinase
MSNQAAQANASLEALVGQVADEFTQRLNRGERPSVEEYVAKHPEIAEELRHVLPALGLLRLPDVEAALADGDPTLAEPLGDFRLVREIGRGAMGVVYEAQQLSLANRKVAVKILPFAAALDPRQLQRFKNEAQAAASLHHEHIVPVYYTDCERGVHFYVMQYIDGLSLAAIIAELRRQAGREPADPQRTMPCSSPADARSSAGTDTLTLAELTTEGSMHLPGYFPNVARLGLEAAKGLEHAHQEVVWHRDIKPANLLVDRRGSLWIADFGLAQIRSNMQLTQPGELVGTYRYMSPEQALAKRVPVDHRTDVYSLGATLYELLTLEPVFGGNDSQELLRQIVFDDPRPPRRLNRDVPRDLETIVMKALAKAPAHRYASAKEMAEDLHLFLNDQPIKARPEGLPRWLWRKSRRYAGSIALGLAAVITSVVLLILLLSLNRPSPEEKEQRMQQEALARLTGDLDLKKKVTLIGEHGPPGYFRVRTNPIPAKLVEAPDGAFSVQSWEHGLIELLPDPRLDRYRFSAEVRHERQIDYECRAGIYFAHSEDPDGDTVAHFHCNVAFNDLVEVGAKDANGIKQNNSVGLQAHRQPPEGLKHDKAYIEKAETTFLPARPVGALGPWRGIAVEVRPKTIKVYWKKDCVTPTSREECIAVTPRADLMRTVRRLIVRPDQPLPANSPQFSPRGGLGLYVSLGVASFRNVIVEPLGDED